MLSRQFIRSGQSCMSKRWFTRSSIARESSQAPKSNNATKEEDVLGTKMYRVNRFDRLMLAWVKRYPSAAEVPDKVTFDCILTSRSKARIKFSNYLIVFTIFGCIGSVIAGKRAVKRGESLSTMRDEWYQEMLEKDGDKRK